MIRPSAVFFFLGILLSSAQVGLHGDVSLGENTPLALHESLHFYQGVIASDFDRAQVEFYNNTNAFNASDLSHSEVKVKVSSQANFIFPSGVYSVYMPLELLDGDGSSATIQAHYSLPPSLNFSREIDKIIAPFYWTVQGEKRARVKLSWNSTAGLDQSLTSLTSLCLVGYTGEVWEIIPALPTPYALTTQIPTSLTEGAIQSKGSIALAQYVAFALGRRSNTVDLNISQAITPNGDGINDVWYIGNIDHYPNAQIWVYNRWGDTVFHSTANYQNNWNARYNNKTKTLPEAPYFYRIDQDNDGNIDVEGWVYITQ